MILGELMFAIPLWAIATIELLKYINEIQGASDGNTRN